MSLSDGAEDQNQGNDAEHPWVAVLPANISVPNVGREVEYSPYGRAAEGRTERIQPEARQQHDAAYPNLECPYVM